VPGLHPLLHDLLPLFAASRYWDRESEGDREETGHGTKWMEHYMRRKALLLSKAMHLFGHEKPERWVVVDD